MKPTFKQFLEAKYYQDRDLYDCPDCGGKGYQTFWYQHGEDDYDRDIEECETCAGRGPEPGKLTKPEYLKLKATHDREDEEGGYIFPRR